MIKVSGPGGKANTTIEVGDDGILSHDTMVILTYQLQTKMQMSLNCSAYIARMLLRAQRTHDLEEIASKLWDAVAHNPAPCSESISYVQNLLVSVRMFKPRKGGESVYDQT